MDNRSVLIDRLVTLFIDNITEEISPAYARAVIQPIIESCLNLIDDKILMNLRSLAVRPYDVGECYVHSGSIYQVTVAHTGGASPDLTKTTVIFSPSNLTISDWVSGAVVNTNQLFYYNGSIIRRTGGTITSYNPNGEGGWKFLNGETVSTTISSAGQNITLDASESQSKAYVLTLQYDLGIEWVNLIRTGIYKLIIFNNTTTAKTVTLNNGVNKNIYNNEALTSLVIPASTRCIFEISTDGAQYYYGGKVLSFSSIVIDENYGPSWIGDTTHAPSRTSIYDKIEAVILDYNNRIDAAIEGVKWKTPVIVLPTENIDLGLDWYNIDGIDIYEGDRVALALQSNPTENGIYVLGSDNFLTRSTDADTGDELAIAQFIVLQGSHANETWGVNNRTISLGSTAISLSIRNNNTTPDATETVAGKGKIASDSQVDAQLTSDPSLPLQSNIWISLRGLKRALNWVIGLFWTKSESDSRYFVSQNSSGGFYDFVRWFQQNSVDRFPVPVIKDWGITSGSTINITTTTLTTAGKQDADILYIDNRKGSGNITLVADESTVFFSFTGFPNIVLAPKEAVILIRISHSSGVSFYKQFGPFTYGGSGGGGTWGSIIGTLSDQTDLWAALTAKQDTLGYTAENIANKGAANGYAPLVSGLVPSSYLPSFVDDIVEGYLLTGVFYEDSGHTIAITGAVGKIYVDLTVGQSSKQYRWSGSVYIQITNGLIASTDDVPEGSTNKYWSNALTISSTLTGYTSGTGTISSSDTILTAIQKLNGNDALRWTRGGDTLTAETVFGGTSGNYGIDVRTNGLTSVKFLPSPASAVNYLTFQSATNANPIVTIGAEGASASTGILILPKGAESLYIKNTSGGGTLKVKWWDSYGGVYRNVIEEVGASNAVGIGTGFTTVNTASTLVLGNTSTLRSNNNTLKILAGASTTTASGINIGLNSNNAGAFVPTSGNHHFLNFWNETNNSFQPTSGNANLWFLNFSAFTINQTGSASGSIYGVNWAPTMTSNTGIVAFLRSGMAAGTNKYFMYNDGGAQSYLNGNLSVKTGTATAHLTLGACTSSSASLRLQNGSMPTGGAILDGNLNYDGSNLRFTVSTTDYVLAKTLTASATLDFPSISANSYQDLTITVTGAAVGDIVSLGVDAAAIGANIYFPTPWVSAADTVTIRAVNNDISSSYDPASATFKVSVQKI
jgi:hypothetical protein